MSKFCEKCGAKLPDDALFCEQCGAKTDEEKVTVPPIENENETAFQQNPFASAPVEETPKNGLSPAIIAVFVLAAAALIAAIIFLVIFITGKDDDDSSSKKKKSSSQVTSEVSTDESETTEPDTTEPDTEAPTEAETTTEAPTEETTTIEKTTTAKTTAEETTTEATTTAADDNETPLPVSIEKVPDGMKLVRFGAVSLAVPEEYIVDDDELDYHYIINIDAEDNTSNIAVSYTKEAEIKPKNLVKEFKNAFDDLEIDEVHKYDKYDLYHLAGTVEIYDTDDSMYLSYYIIDIKDSKSYYDIGFTYAKKAPELLAIEETLAFDPDIPFENIVGGDDDNFPDLIKDNFDQEFFDNAESIRSLDGIEGKWECYMVYDYLDAEELGYIYISGTEDDLELKLERRLLHYNGEAPIDESDEEPLILKGNFNDCIIHAEGDIKIDCSTILTDGTKDFILGTITTITGEECPIYLTRS